MIEGRPRLAVWSLDNMLRTFEHDQNSVFAQLAALPVSPTASQITAERYPLVGFDNVEQHVATLWMSGSSTVQFRRYGLTGDEVVSSNSSSSSGYTIFGLIAAIAQGLAVSETSTSHVVRGYTTQSGTTIASGNIPSPRHSLSASPDGTYVLVGSDPGLSQVHTFTEVWVNILHQYNDYTVLSAHNRPIHFSAWSSDSLFFYAVDRSEEGAVTVFRVNAEGGFDAVSVLSSDIGEPWAVAASPDRHHVAVSYRDSEGNFTTVIYRRFGNLFNEHQVLSEEFGRLLDFTGDGSILIDASVKRAYHNNTGAFELDDTGMMANVPDNVRSQAVSDHAQSIRPVSRLYDGAVAALTMGSLNPESLKLVLLSDAAVFDRQHASLSEVTDGGAHEVFGGGWQQGGMPLVGVAPTVQGVGLVALTAEELKAIIYDGAVAFRYTVIVDQDGTPLVFSDYHQTVDIMNNQELSFDFTPGFVAYSV